MSGWPAALAGAAMAAFASALGTFAWIALAKHWRVHDEPGQRRMHAQTTPRAGGLAVALAWWLAMGLSSAWSGPGVVSHLPWLLLVTGAFFSLGLLDDFLALPAAPKLLLQVAIVALVFTPLLSPSAWAQPLLLGLLWLGFLYFVNAWNFMDGSNGMIGGQSLVVALAIATWPGQDAGLRVAALALAGACLGFLPFNVPKAKVFLGDCGSFLLGSAIFLMLLASCAGGAMHPLQALLLVSVVLLDTALTLAWRIYRGRRFWQAHREHLYQLAVRKGRSHARVAATYAMATVAAWLLALCLPREPSGIVDILIPTLAWGCGVAAYTWLRREWLGRRRSMEGQA
jgi:UDP-N-acetylmuramyl pentapeptide phosphotransferase/UDP-N-acetylglucosamine-1-phosphate transferase